MAKGGPVKDGYSYDSGGDYQGNHLSCTFNFNEQTRALSGAVVHRDPGCLYVAVVFGQPDGVQVRIPAAGEIPEGDTAVSKGQLNSNGFSTIEDVLNLGQISATF